MKKVLIITYYWPPSGGGGVQRWLKFVKYLPEYGWEPVVFTPENPDFAVQDRSLQKDISPNLEVIKFPIWEPFGIYKKLFAKTANTLQQGIVIENKNPSFFDKLSIWMRGNLFIPDPRRFWAKPSAKFLESIISDNKIDTVVTTGPPHSMHVIGKKLKKTTGVNWVADFRDPWVDWDILDKLLVGSLALKIHKRYQDSVINSCDLLLTTSDRLSQKYRDLYTTKVATITNGVDLDDFKFNKPEPDRFTIFYSGLMNELRNPEIFCEAIDELINENPELRDHLSIRLFGMVSESILDKINSTDNLSRVVEFKGYVGHEEVINEMSSASVLLLLLNQTEKANLTIPGKLFEYLFAYKPILALGPTDNDTNNILLESGQNGVIDYSDKNAIKEFILTEYSNYKSNKILQPNSNIDRFSRKELTKQLAAELDALTR